MARPLAWVGKALVVGAFLAAPLGIHAAITHAGWPLLGPALAGLQLLILGLVATVRHPSRVKWVLAGAVALFAALLWASEAGVDLRAMPGVPHALAYCTLLTIFGLSLAPGHTPVITRVAASIRGTLAPELVVYTRRVTIAWCCFFALQILTSLALYRLAPFNVWSLFVNVLNMPLLILMFAAEYTYRITTLRHYRHLSVSDMIRVATKTGQPRSPEATSI